MKGENVVEDENLSKYKINKFSMESALYGIYALVDFISENHSFASAHSFVFWYVNSSGSSTSDRMNYEELWDGAYGLLSLSEKTRKKKLNMTVRS